MNKKIIITVIIIIVLIIGFMYMQKSKGWVGYSETTNTIDTGTTTSAVTLVDYTLAQVALHPNAASCWTVVQGSVYDMTNWIERHPGGERAILGMCGKDGTQDFMDEHGGQGRPERELAKYKIGTLVQ